MFVNKKVQLNQWFRQARGVFYEWGFNDTYNYNSMDIRLYSCVN